VGHPPDSCRAGQARALPDTQEQDVEQGQGHSQASGCYPPSLSPPTSISSSPATTSSRTPHAWNQLDVKSKEFASVNLIPLLHKALSESLTQVVYEGREASDTEYLLRELFEQQHRLKRNNVEDVRISELQIQIDLLFAEKELHELMVEVAAGCLKDDLRQESSVDLMLAVVANLRNIELARQVLLNLWDRIYARAQFIDALRFNKFAVASFVNHITQFISITEALKQKEDLVMDSRRTAQFGEMLLLLTLSTEEFSHMNLRKTFKQEYISPFLWYLLRHTLKNWRLNPEVALSKPHLEALTRFNRRMQELQEDNLEDMAIKAILLKNLDKLATPTPLARTADLNLSVLSPGHRSFSLVTDEQYYTCTLRSSGKKHYRLVDDSDQHLKDPVFGYGALIHCAADEKIEFAECPVYSVIPSDSNTLNSLFFSHYDPNADPELLNSISNVDELIVSGKLISSVSQDPTLLETGITCVLWPYDSNGFAFYKKETKQASFSSSMEHNTMLYYSSTHLLRRSDHFRTVVDLDQFPAIAELSYYKEDECAVLVDIEGGVVLISFEKGRNSESCRGVAKALRSVFGIAEPSTGNRDVKGMSINYFRKTEINVKSIYIRSDFTAIAVIQIDSDTVIVDQMNNKKLKFEGQRLKKVLAKKPKSDLIIFYLFESGKLYILDSRHPNKSKYFKTKQRIIDFGLNPMHFYYIEEQTDGSLVMKEGTIGKFANNVESKMGFTTALTPQSRILGSFDSTRRLVLNVKEFHYFGNKKMGDFKQKDCAEYQPLNQTAFPASVFFNFETGKIEAGSAEEFDTKEFAISKADIEGLKVETQTVEAAPEDESKTEAKTEEAKPVEQVTEQKQEIVETKSEPTITNESEDKPAEKQSNDKPAEEIKQVPKKIAESLAKRGAMAIWTAGPLPFRIYELFVKYHKSPEPRRDISEGDYYVFRKNECVVEKTMPTELAAVQFIIKTKGDVFDLSKLKDALKDVYDEPKVSVLPYFLDLSTEEFAVFKETHKAVWESDYVACKSEFLKTREEVITILAKKIEDENYSRTNFYDLLKKDFKIVDSSEYTDSRPIESEREENDRFEVATLCLQYLNVWIAQYFKNRPIFNRQNIEARFKQKSQHITIPTFAFNFRGKMSFEDYRYNSVDRLRGVKKTTLKTQNGSLLNQLTMGGAYKDEDQGNLHTFLFQKLELQFRGERKCRLTQPESTPEGRAETISQERRPSCAIS
jgi:hypothetical protein